MEPAVVDMVKGALPLLLRYSQLTWNYDRAADVLYVNFEGGAATDSDLSDDDIVVRYRNDEVIGITILDASKRVPALAAK